MYCKFLIISLWMHIWFLGFATVASDGLKALHRIWDTQISVWTSRFLLIICLNCYQHCL